MILVSTLRKLVEQDGYVFVASIPAHSFNVCGKIVTVEARKELFAKRPPESLVIIETPIHKATGTITRERARDVAHFCPIFDSLYGVR